MNLLEARDAVAELLGELPQQIHDMLEDVSCQVLAFPTPDVDPGAKGVFVGLQQEGAPEEDTDDDEIVHAKGTIQLFAANLEDAVDAQRAGLHEIGHALGLSEWDVMELGLS